MKKKLIYILIALSVILLAANVLINLLTKKEPISEATEVSALAIDSVFTSSINKFNLDSTWVTTISINSAQYDSLNKVYRVLLPADVRPAIVLYELRQDFQAMDVKLISDEKVINSETTLNILAKDKLKLQATFTMNDELVREHASFSFILSDFFLIDEENQQQLYYSIIPFSILVKPSLENDSLITGIFDYKKTYSVLIDDGIEADNYRLEAGLSKTRLKESVRYITWNYPAAELFVINNNSSLFRSAIFNFINDEFNSRDKKLYLINDLIVLPEEINEAESLMKFYLESSLGEKGKLILVNANIFQQLLPLLDVAKQRGTKFYNPQELIELNSNEDPGKN